MMMRKAPSLVDLCVQLAIDNIRYLGDVGCIDCHLLDRILSHCTVENLAHIEDRTEGRDLTPVTDKYWMKFCKKQFPMESKKDDVIIERLRQKNMTFTWRKLYEARLKKREEDTKKFGDRLKQRYKEADAKKQSRQIQLCSKVPPSSKKRSYWGGPGASNICNTKSNLMKKAKIEFVNSREVKNIVAMKKMAVQRNHSAPSKEKAIVASGYASSSSNKPVQNQRRF
ncbi:hypothetical protein ACS0TY_017251 [Phlomoides rotata]